MTQKNDIIILGCGIAGMLTALALEKKGISTTIIEKKDVSALANPDDPRTTALNTCATNFMDDLGAVAPLSEFIEPIRDIFVCQDMRKSVFHLEGKESDIGYMVENTHLRRVLFEITSKKDKINIVTESVYENLKPFDSHIEFDVTSKSGSYPVSAKLAIAADGKFSAAKSQFFKDGMSKDYRQKAMVFNIEHELAHEGGAIEHFLPRGTFASLPLPGKKSGIVWVESSDIADFYVKQDHEVIEREISKFIGGSLGAIRIVSKPEYFPLIVFISERYYHKRLVLVSDSAHCMHPLAGQGLNMGIKDVIKLTELIADNAALGLDFDTNMLQKYESARKIDNIMMTRITDVINSVFTSQSKILSKTLETALGIVNRSPFIKKLIIDYGKGYRKFS